ncbi:BnaC05g33060D [Brassica napus]|uniref:(rape) hypothetical protein n=1 Tax=Brassica napus TaxID=3708 RepID=A0A078GHI7_BRANA|nr:unnamed protein product [Brassica napus]CDY24622.1 BnaC05g33060D [Brassica napus]
MGKKRNPKKSPAKKKKKKLYSPASSKVIKAANPVSLSNVSPQIIVDDDTSLDSATRASPVDGSASPEDGYASPASPISESKSSASVKVVTQPC